MGTRPDLVERQPPRPQTSPLSWFLWAGLTCLALAAILGIGAVLRAAGQKNGSPGQGIVLAILILAAGVVLFYAQARYLFWRKASGIVEPLPLEISAFRVVDSAPDPSRYRIVFLLTALTALAAIPRLFAMQHSLWANELWTLDFVLNGPSYALTHQQGYNNHLLNSALISLLCDVRAAMKGVSPENSPPPIWLLRLPAFLFGLASLPVFYATVRRLTENPVAIAATLMLALSPAAVDFSAQARGYSALIFFTIGQTYFFCRALREQEAAHWVFWLLCAALGMMSHLYFAYVVITDVLFLCCRAIRCASVLHRQPEAIANIEQALVMAVACIVLSAAGYLGILRALLDEIDHHRGIPPLLRAHEVVLPLLQSWGGVPSGKMLLIFYAVSVVLGLLGLWYLYNRSSGAVLFIPLLLVVPLLLVELATPHLVYPRFFAFALPAFLMLLACGGWQCTQWTIGRSDGRSVWRQATLYGLIVLFVLITLPGLHQVMYRPRQDFAQMAVTLDRTGRGKTVVGLDASSRFLARYGISVQRPQNRTELLDILGKSPDAFLVFVDMPARGLSVKALEVIRTGRLLAGKPIQVFPGRYSDWPYRWQDGDSDLKLYRNRRSEVKD